MHVYRTATFTKVYMMGVAYSSNIGGTGVITGTNPNLVLLGILTE